MARVGVEKQALTDARFVVLGSHLNPLGTAPHELVNAAFGLFMAIRVWDYCSDRGLLVVHRRDLEAIYPGLAAAMLDAELAEVVPRSGGKRIRLCGGDGRLDWYVKALENGRRGAEFGKKGAEYGKRGGRPRASKPPTGGIEKPPTGGIQKTPPLALALSPALSGSEVSSAPEVEPEGVGVAEGPAASLLDAAEAPALLVFPCSGKRSTWNLTARDLALWEQLYPKLDLMQECRKALAYVHANGPKTHKGMPAFLVNWFNRAADRGPSRRETWHEKNQREVDEWARGER